MKDEFLATLSHELRTPLNAVLGWAHILRIGKLQGDELKQGLGAIERNARAQAQIIEDLLDMSRIISGKVRLDVEQIDLPAVLNESIDTIRATAEAKGIRLHALVDPRAGPISGDPDRLQQVFWNLLNNAIKFTPKGGHVEVLLERVNSHIEVTVMDTGEGIAPEFLPYASTVFNRGTRRQLVGMADWGSGWLSSSSLSSCMAATFALKAMGLGKGQAFTVHLPLIALSSEPDKERRHFRATPRENQPLPGVSLDKVHVLIVDDEVDCTRVRDKAAGDRWSDGFDCGLRVGSNRAYPGCTAGCTGLRPRDARGRRLFARRIAREQSVAVFRIIWPSPWNRQSC
jgi:His Kinase A (phospho-acceptor) domain/Histidine kinase-, DNA gyrase B-, and HSP90-like ATPase